MLFPLELKGMLTLPRTVLPAGYLAAVGELLTTGGASTVIRGENRITFRAPWTISSGTLQYLDCGYVSTEGVENGYVSYSVSLRRACIHALVLFYLVGGAC